MVNYISSLAFILLLLVGAAIVVPLGQARPGLAVLLGIAWVVADLVLASSILLAAQ